MKNNESWLNSFCEKMDGIEWMLFIATFISSVVCMCICSGSRLAWLCCALWIVRTMIEKKTTTCLKDCMFLQRELFKEQLGEEHKIRKNLENTIELMKTKMNIIKSNENIKEKGDDNKCIH